MVSTTLQKATPAQKALDGVVDRIIALLDEGLAPWVRPWRSLGSLRNAHTNQAYRGLNILSLSLACEDFGYQDHRFLTFKQARALGGTVRRDEKGHKIFFAKTYVKRLDGEDDGDEDLVSLRYALKCYTVFNVEQCDIPELEDQTPITAHHTDSRDDVIEAFIRAIPAQTSFGGDRAFFRPSEDAVTLPPFEAFTSADRYYSTFFHELTHWTGHSTRLDRKFGKSKGDSDYAFEELIAELGAAMLCSHFGINDDLRHSADYLGFWLGLLRDDKNALRKASRFAGAATDLLHSFSTD